MISFIVRMQAVPLKSLKSKVKYRISRSSGTVFTPGDFFDLSGRDQVGRALRQLVAEQELIRFGQGLYAKAKRSSLTGKLIPEKPLPELAREALSNKLKVQVLSARDLERYNNGESTQVPTGRVIAVKGRVSRKMAYDGKSIKYQYVS
ncbi:MAG: hypothetical protein CMG77_09805 [Marinimicrobium sp.]|nr:hypothetical protein [Marinimicrobium sp.]